MPSIVFGPVTVTNISFNASQKSCQIKLRQETTTTYGPDETPHLSLEQQLTGDYDQRVVHGKRTNTQTVSVETGQALQTGQTMPGHIKRIIHATAQYPNHSSAYEGGYALTQFCPAYEPDVDLRQHEPA